ncbi:hypothetical protein EDE08_10768 [Bradyrhizobium sp. R2.2-H]|nr:hypothetical protein EDE10_10768 [Bradyrhizobium sp. Y-H1]TCU71822.1 hypothetical protein EDE08_10768 [Bradyrhizobium sp. R2.2-H]
MSVPAYSSFSKCYYEGRQAFYVRTGKSPGRILDMLERTDLPTTAIALEARSSSNQVLARVFVQHMRLNPSNYRRTVRDPVRPSIPPRAHSALEGRQ